MEKGKAFREYEDYLGSEIMRETVGVDTEIQQEYFLAKKKRFYCPYRSEASCTSSPCFKDGVRIHSEIEKESFQQLRIVQIKKEVVFDHDLCVERGYEKEEEIRRRMRRVEV